MSDRMWLIFGVCIWAPQLIFAETLGWAIWSSVFLSTVVVALVGTFKKSAPPPTDADG